MSSRNGKKKIGLIGRIIWLFNILFALTLLASYLSPYVNPKETTLFAFLGLSYLILLLLNALFMLFWMIRGRRKFLLSLIIILIGYQPLIRHIQVLPGRESPKDGTTMLMSYNVQNMAHSNIGIHKANLKNEIYGFIESEGGDIICLQEFAHGGRDFSAVINEMATQTQYPYCYYSKYYPRAINNIYGMVILSRYPAIRTGNILQTGKHHQFGMYADLLVKGDTIRVYNIHLASVKLRHDDYQFVDDITRGQAEKDKLRRASSSIVRKLQVAFKHRSKQVEVVMQSLADCPYPLILCGDFNDTPLSYAYRKVSKGLNDAFVNAGYGLGNTFTGNLPPVRIDFILHSPSFNSYEFEVHDVLLSDHYPVSVNINMN